MTDTLYNYILVMVIRCLGSCKKKKKILLAWPVQQRIVLNDKQGVRPVFGMCLVRKKI